MTQTAPTALHLAMAKTLEDLAETEPDRAHEHQTRAAQLRGESCVPPAPRSRTYVAIRSALVFGPANDVAIAEGLIFELQPDRSLRRLDGPGLVQFAEDHPGFARHGSIDDRE
ncbi:hypothetical protein L2D01_01815 [Hyphomonadaceae bacterium ML37]|nr:hypothetical protein L2D01_01815 [Hyphomonadaceae bacterium ML37]